MAFRAREVFGSFEKRTPGSRERTIVWERRRNVPHVIFRFSVFSRLHCALVVTLSTPTLRSSLVLSQGWLMLPGVLLCCISKSTILSTLWLVIEHFDLESVV